MFAKSTDSFVREQMEMHGSIILGTRRMEPKKRDMSEKMIKQWEGSLGFLNIMVFQKAFTEAKARGILSAAEMAVGQEIIDAIEKG